MQKIVEILAEMVGWIQIVLSPTLLGMVFGYIVYYNFPSPTGMIIGILIAVIGLIGGIAWATKKYRTTGTIHFLSRISATPELDKVENSKIQNTKNEI